MKLFLLSFIIVCSCVNNNSPKSMNLDFGPRQEKSFYDIILLSEIKTIDLKKYFLNVTISDKIIDFQDSYGAMIKGEFLSENEIENLRRLETITEPHSKISSELLSILAGSRSDTTNKRKISYEFSIPYSLPNDKVLVFNKVSFIKPSSGDIKGGVERVFVFIKKNNSWVINEKMEIMEF